jgi:hypothetical protein
MEVKYVCSLGTTCHSARFLEKNKLKLCSYPFDWILSKPDNIISCIRDGFKVFLDKSYYVNINSTRCGHKAYHRKMFFHRNPLTNKDDYDYYVRCVNRFKELLRYEEHKLFIMMFLDQNESNIIKFNKQLSKYVDNYTLLVINQKVGKKRSHVFKKKDGIDFMELQTVSISTGRKFIMKDDNNYLNNVIKTKYVFRLNAMQ